ncbi:hypothetical protein LXA52_17975, partial [Erwinia amylovora]|uniref:hypothetical protein n=1 Tax=Erwinia amylovora TaxID=552 RepID=UPI0020C0B23D
DHRRRNPGLQLEGWWGDGDGTEEWLTGQGRPLNLVEREQGVLRMQIRLSIRVLITLNAT